METALEGPLEFRLIFVVHSDANCKLGILFSNAGPSANLGDHARVFDLSMLCVGSETSGPELLVECCLREADSLVRLVDSRLPFGLLS